VKIKDFLNEGDVVAFPTHMAKRDSLMSRLGKASSKYDDKGEHLKPYVIADDDFNFYGEYKTADEAEKHLATVMLKTGKRDLYVTKK
jgi:hypothetical protein